ncbi:MAG: hypothetical protein GY895_19220 [Phycisphaera sp.]|nr:hypothetical protein [Phycisphaera sp.]
MASSSFRPIHNCLLLAACVLTGGLSSVAVAEDKVARALNQMMPQVSDENTAWTGLFDAYLDLTPCPTEIGPEFDQIDVWPGMGDWGAIEDWASSNKDLAKAIKDASTKTIIGLPYGKEAVDRRYQDAGLYAQVLIGDGGEVEIGFPYLNAFRTFSTWATAEMYRRFDAGEWAEGIDVVIDNARVLRQLCDREMLAEKSEAMLMLAESMSVIRDAMWRYVGKMPTDQLRRISTKELPFLRVADAERLKRLELPEGDRVVVEAIIEAVFDGASSPDPQRLGEVFGAIQSDASPLTRFGATKRWEKIAEFHGSLEASKGKLVDVYDDWWRRWRIRPYDPIQEVPTELSLLNEVRYAIIAESVADLEDLFDLRLRLIVEINGTIMSAGLCGYRTDRGVWPRDREQAYVTYIPKRFDFDPFDKSYGRFLFDFLGDDRRAVDTDYGRLYVDQCVVYARGKDHENSDFKEATLDGITGDMIVWPPLRALAREQGIID